MKIPLLSKEFKIIVAIIFIIFISGAAAFAYGYKQDSSASSFSVSLNVAKTASSTTYVLGKRTKTANCKVNGPLPDSACTPGATQTTDLNIICYQSTKLRRNVTSATSNKIYKEYGITKPTNNTGKNQKYEVDHFIPLELGGSNDISNLFPEAATPTPGFHEKDNVENYLHKLVCNRSMSIQKAQYEIATNWVKYYIFLTTGRFPSSTSATSTIH